MQTRIYVLPVEVESVQGRNTAMVDVPGNRQVTRKYNKSSGIQVPIPFERDPTTKKLRTGLEEMVDNKYHGEGNPLLEELPSNWQQYKEEISSKERITLQTEIEIFGNLPKGSLTSDSQVPLMSEVMVNPKLIKESKSNMLDEFIYYLPANNMHVLDANKNFRDCLGILAIMNSSKVAKDRGSINSNKHLFFVSTAEEGMAMVSQQRNKLTSTIARLDALLKNTTPNERFKFAINLGLIRKTNEIDSLVTPAIEDYVWEDKKYADLTKAERLTKFNMLCDEFQKDKDKFECNYLYQMANITRVLRIVTGHIYWTSQREMNPNLYDLGTSQTAVIKRLIDSKKSYDPIDVDNIWALLNNELKRSGVVL